MEAEKTWLLVPDSLISTSRDPSEKTDRFVKTLSALFGAPILRRGKDSLGEIAYTAKENNFKTLIIAHNVQKSGFSELLIYKLVNNEYFEKFATLHYELLHFTEIRTPYDAVKLFLRNKSDVGLALFNSLRECFISYDPKAFVNRSFDVKIENVVSAYIAVVEGPNQRNLAKLTFEKLGRTLLSLRGYIRET